MNLIIDSLSLALPLLRFLQTSLKTKFSIELEYVQGASFDYLTGVVITLQT